MYNVIIKGERQVLSAQAFYYDRDRHILNYKIDEEWQTISNVKCEIQCTSCIIILSTTSLEDEEDVK